MRHDGLAGTITADMEYPMRVAFVLLMNMMDQYAEQIPWKTETREEAISFAPMNQAIVEYQDPAKADDLVDRSDTLSRQSKMFYKQARKTNSCCVVM